MAKVGNIVFEISADLKNIKGQLNTLENSFQSSFGKISSLASGLAASLGVGLSLTSVVTFGKSIVQMASQLKDLSQQTGFAASTLSGFKSVIEENGSTVESFARAMFNLQQRIGSIDKTSDPLIETIKRLGLSFEDLRRSTPEEVGKKITEALAKIPDQATRVSLGFALMGRQFREFMPAMEELAKHWEQLRKSGLSQEDVDKLDEVGDAFTRLWNRFLVWGSSQAIRAYENLRNLRDTMQGLGMVSARPELRPGAGEFGTEVTGFPGAAKAAAPPLVDKEAENRLKSLTESLQKQIIALKAQEIALTQGEAASMQYKLTQEALEQLETTKLTPAVKKQIDAIVELNSKLTEGKIRFQGLKEEGEKLLQFQRDIIKGIEEEIKVREQQEKAINAALVEGVELELQQLQIRLGNYPEGMRPKTVDAIEQMKKEWESLFDSITSGIETTLQGVMLGTQSMGEAMKRLAQNIGISFLEEFTKLAAINPLKNWLFGLTGEKAAPTLNMGSMAGGILSSIPWFQSGGIVPGSPGQAVPIVAHGGERVIPSGQSGGMRTVVNINGDILPRQNWVTKEEVVSIGYQQFNDRGGWMSVVESRMSPR